MKKVKRSALILTVALLTTNCTNEQSTETLSTPLSWNPITQNEVEEIEEFWATAPADCEDIKPPIMKGPSVGDYHRCRSHKKREEIEFLVMEISDQVDLEKLQTDKTEQEKVSAMIATKLQHLQRQDKPLVKSQGARMGFVKSTFDALGKDVSGREGFAWVGAFVKEHQLEDET